MNKISSESTPHYRIWVYCFNAIMLALQVLFVISAWRVFQHDRMSLFPFAASDLSLIYLNVAFCVQIFACLCGIWAVYRSNRVVLRLYWMLMVPLMINDILIGIIWAIRFRQLHLHYSDFLASLWSEQIELNSNVVSTSFCDVWNDVQQSYHCCGPLGLDQLTQMPTSYCGQELNGTMIPPSCCPQTASSAGECTAESAFQLACDKPLLKWIHSQADLLSIIGYWCLFPLKLIFIAVLRKEMAEIFVEIYKAGNQEVFRHWAEGMDQHHYDDNSGNDFGNTMDLPDYPHETDHMALLRKNGTIQNGSQLYLSEIHEPPVRFRIEPVSTEDLT